MDHPILNSKPESAEAIGGEALNVKEIDSNVPAGNTVSPSEGGPVLTPKAPEETTDRTAGGDPGADRAAAEERKDVDAEPQSHDAAEVHSEDSDFFIVTVQKGENLSKIAAQWFPEDADSGKKLILAANPLIHDQNLLLAGQTLRVPKKRAGDM